MRDPWIGEHVGELRVARQRPRGSVDLVCQASLFTLGASDLKQRGGIPVDSCRRGSCVIHWLLHSTEFVDVLVHKVSLSVDADGLTNNLLSNINRQIGNLATQIGSDPLSFSNDLVISSGLDLISFVFSTRDDVSLDGFTRIAASETICAASPFAPATWVR